MIITHVYSLVDFGNWQHSNNIFLISPTKNHRYYRSKFQILTICPVCMHVEIMIEAISTFTNISIDLPWKLLLVLSILGLEKKEAGD